MGGAYLPWILLLAFFVVIGLELFVPSAGTLFFLSILLAVSAVVLAFFQSMGMGVLMLTIVVLSIPILIAGFGYIWPHTPLGRKFTIAAPDAQSVLPDSLTRNPLAQLKGQLGEVTVPMLPTGEIQIEGRRYRASCQSGSADVGQKVRVIQIRMGRLVVLPAEIADDHTADGGFETSLDQAVEETSFEDFQWDDGADSET